MSCQWERKSGHCSKKSVSAQLRAHTEMVQSKGNDRNTAAGFAETLRIAEKWLPDFLSIDFGG
jgi:hypothetical protein